MGQHEKDFTAAQQPDESDRIKSVEVASGEQDGSSRRVLIDRVLFCYDAGQTKRWHAMPHVIRQENIASHSWGVMMLIILLHPNPSVQLLKAAAVHDVAEHVTGDIPRWAKEAGLKEVIDQLEKKILTDFDIDFPLDEADRQWLRAADLFEAWLFLRQNLLAGNQTVRDSYNRAGNALKAMGKPVELIEVFSDIKWSLLS